MDAKEFFLLHGEKVALGLAGVIVLLGLFGMLGGTASEASEINRLVDAVADGMKKDPPPLPTLDDLETIQARWEPPASVEGLRPWAMHKRPYVQRILLPKPEDDIGPDPIHHPPTLSLVDRGTDFLEIRFGGSVENEAEIVRLELFRTTRTDRDGKPVFPQEPYKDFRTNEKTFRDEEGIRPRQTVYYKVRSVARHTGKIPLPEVRQALETATLPVNVPSDVYLLPISITKGSVLKKIPAEARITVQKWFPDQTKWRTKSYTVKVGDEIGKVEKVGGKGEVDWRTGFKLIGAEERERMISVGPDQTVPRTYFWIKYQSTTHPDAPAEEVENVAEYRKMLSELKKSNKLIPGEDPGEGSKDETGSTD